jgi:predicted dehydrogenase
MNAKIRVGVLSAGAWSVAVHIPELKKHKDIELIVVTNQILETATKIQEMFGFENAFDSWEKALELNLDAVIVSSPPIAHEAMVIAALNSGTHVLCEKPFAINGKSAAKMLAAAKDNSRSLLIGFGWPYTNIFVRVRNLIRENLIGNVEFATLGVTCGIREILDGATSDHATSTGFMSEKNTYSDPKIAAGGAIGTTMSHSLGLLIHLLGDSFDWVASSSFPAAAALDYHESVSGQMKNGASVNMYCVSTFGSAPHVSWRFEAYGSKGDLRVDPTRREIAFHGAIGDSWVEKFKEEDVAYKSYMPTALLLERARGNEIPEGCDSSLGQLVVNATDGIYESWQTGSRSRVEG